MAARSYFGKPAKELDLMEGALLAGLTKGPNYFSPERQPERARERLAYVLSRMKEDGAIGAADQAVKALPTLAAYDRPRRDTGFYVLDQFVREAKASAGIDALTASSYLVHSTVNPDLQRATEAALQEGLARYELNTGRLRFTGAEANLGEAVQRAAASDKTGEPPWRVALKSARLPLYDVHWTPAIVVEKTRGKNTGETIRVGLGDGRILALTAWNAAIRRSLNLHDVIYVRVAQGKGKAPARADLRVRPTVQGAAVVLENKTGRVLAMVGGFSYPQSQLNRVTQARRQPGSTFKPLTYLAALNRGLQPNTLVWDAPVTLPPVGGGRGDDWSPKNYDGGASGLVTLRRALENSKNLVTARLLDGAIAASAEQSLKRVCELAVEAQLYLECEPYYPFVLGAQPVRALDLAAFYAAIANEGARPSPYVLESVEQAGQVLYRHEAKPAVALGSADRVAFYQLKTMLQGVVERGTAASMRKLAPYVAGKTGTTENENDAWFVGFTNEVTVAVWMGYDNADGKQRRTLGRGMTGAKAAIPIFEPIIEAVWANYAPKTALAPPSSEAARQLVAAPIDLRSGERLPEGTRTAFVEHFRADRLGHIDDTQYRLVPREQAYAYRMPDALSDGDGLGAYGEDYAAPRGNELYERQYGDSRGYDRRNLRQGPYAQTPYGQAPSWDDEPPRRLRPVALRRGGRPLQPPPAAHRSRLFLAQRTALLTTSSRVRAAFVAALVLCAPARAEGFRVEEVPSVTSVDPARLQPGTILFSDHGKDPLADPNTGLFRFEDWARERPVEKQLLSLYPAFVEPVVAVTAHGVTKQVKQKLHVYVVEARFLVPRPASAIDLKRYATLAFLERIDPAIK